MCFNWSVGSRAVFWQGPSVTSISNGSLSFPILQKNVTLIVNIVSVLYFFPHSITSGLAHNIIINFEEGDS
jgi:hypothetical protein